YWRFDEDSRAVAEGYPKPLSLWEGVPSGSQAAFLSQDGVHTFFVKGDRYWKFNIDKKRVESGFPRSLLRDWMGCDVGGDGRGTDDNDNDGRDEEEAADEDEGGEVEVVEEEMDRALNPLVLVLPCLLLLGALAGAVAVLAVRRRNAAKPLRYCQRSIRQWRLAITATAHPRPVQRFPERPPATKSSVTSPAAHREVWKVRRHHHRRRRQEVAERSRVPRSGPAEVTGARRGPRGRPRPRRPPRARAAAWTRVHWGGEESNWRMREERRAAVGRRVGLGWAVRGSCVGRGWAVGGPWVGRGDRSLGHFAGEPSNAGGPCHRHHEGRFVPALEARWLGTHPNIVTVLASPNSRPHPQQPQAKEAFRSVVLSDAASMDTVLVLGGGAREHVLAGTLAQSPLVKKVIVAPGNGGTATHGGKVENSGVSVANHSLLVQYCADHNVSMVVVGPEAPLAAGVSDDLVAAGVRCFGPSARAARLESSKAFAKAFMERHGIPTARWEAFTEPRAACAYINSTEPAPLVVKASGLAGGKGVVVARDREEACRVVMEMMQDRVHGDAGETVLVEEVLEGEEISCMCFTDGRSVVMMPPAQDHKRLGEGDTGPNTGGMGAYAPTPQVSADLLSMVQRCVLQKTVDGMMEEGNPYIGVLYAGLMLTKAGPKVLEFNCRFGDPECQVLLPLLKSDVYAVVRACASGSGGCLADERVEWWSGRSAVTVVMASRGYPGDATTGFPITGISRAQELGCLVFHGATKTRAAGGGAAAGAAAAAAAGGAAGGDDDDDGWRQQLVTSGGRVLSVTAVGRDLRAALTLATSGVAAIHFQGAFHRRDIAHRGLAEGAREAAPLLPPLTYAGSGVDIDAADALVTSIKPLAAATARPGEEWVR
ncbi:unnamed protein product, partial [Lampetra fluviatilis]